MPSHMNEVPGSGDNTHQAYGAWNGMLGTWRHFNSVKEQVIRTGMIRIPAHYGLERMHRLFCACGGRPILAPPLPAVKDHQALAEQRHDIQIVRIAESQLTHGAAVSGVKPVRVSFGVIGAPGGE